MNQENQYVTFDDAVVAAQAPVDARVAFLRKTYTLLLAAILLFAVTMWLAAQPGPIRNMAASMLGISPWLYLGIMIGGSMLVHAVAEKPGIGIATFFVFAFIWGLLTAPFILAVASVQPEVITQAALITAMVFTGITAYVFKSGKDFSFLGGTLYAIAFGLIGLSIAGWLFGFALGIWVAYLVVLLFAGFILYDTSRILNHYPTTAYVSAAMVLFVNVIIMFKYLIMILMNRD